MKTKKPKTEWPRGLRHLGTEVVRATLVEDADGHLRVASVDPPPPRAKKTKKPAKKTSFATAVALRDAMIERERLRLELDVVNQKIASLLKAEV